MTDRHTKLPEQHPPLMERLPKFSEQPSTSLGITHSASSEPPEVMKFGTTSLVFGTTSPVFGTPYLELFLKILYRRPNDPRALTARALMARALTAAP